MKRIMYIIAVVATLGIFATGCTTQRVYGQDDYGYYPNRNNNDGYYGNNNSYGNGGYYDNGYDRYDNGYGGGNITFNDFYNELSPYGSWRNHSRYGRVWTPSIRNFRPYATNGYWVNTNMGWNWVSNYDWGWAPFHYGRWGYDNMFGGWYWVPDYTWGPAWVNWGSGPDYYGWAPLGPGMNVGVNINIGSIASIYWNFLPSRYMGYRNMYDYYLPYSRNNYYVRNTTIINNYNYYDNSRSSRYYSGPSSYDVSRRTGRDVRTYDIQNTGNRSYNGHVSNDRLSVYTGTNRSYTPSRSTNNSVDNRNSGSSRSYTPSRSYDNNNVNRSNSSSSTPNRSYTPSRNSSSDSYDRNNNSSTSPSRSYTPSRSSSSYERSSAPATSSPSRSYTPSRSSSSYERSSAPATSSPSRSYTPSRSSSSYERSSAPASSSPSRSYTPSRSSSSYERSSAPATSSPSRSYTPSRSSSSSSSPASSSRSSSSAPSRSYSR